MVFVANGTGVNRIGHDILQCQYLTNYESEDKFGRQHSRGKETV